MNPSVPTAGQVFEDLRGIEAMLEGLEDDYFALEDLARTGGSTRPRGDSAGKVSHGVTTPTEDAALSGWPLQEFRRRRARKAAKLIGSARARLVECRDLFDEVFDRTEEKAEAAASGTKGTFLERDQLNQSVAAKARRRSRGEL